MSLNSLSNKNQRLKYFFIIKFAARRCDVDTENRSIVNVDCRSRLRSPNPMTNYPSSERKKLRSDFSSDRLTRAPPTIGILFERTVSGSACTAERST